MTRLLLTTAIAVVASVMALIVTWLLAAWLALWATGVELYHGDGELFALSAAFVLCALGVVLVCLAVARELDSL